VFLYQEGSYNPDILLEGLFRGHFLTRVSLFVSITNYSQLIHSQCCRCIFLGPQNAMSTPVQVVVRKACVANRLNVTRITPEIIAYICVQARFALTTAASWSYKDWNFNYKVFHRKILELFQPGNGRYHDTWVINTLQWWNMYAFIIFTLDHADTVPS
jgi:hypothetical protein